MLNQCACKDCTEGTGWHKVTGSHLPPVQQTPHVYIRTTPRQQSSPGGSPQERRDPDSAPHTMRQETDAPHSAPVKSSNRAQVEPTVERREREDMDPEEAEVREIAALLIQCQWRVWLAKREANERRKLREFFYQQHELQRLSYIKLIDDHLKQTESEEWLERQDLALLEDCDFDYLVRQFKLSWLAYAEARLRLMLLYERDMEARDLVAVLGMAQLQELEPHSRTSLEDQEFAAREKLAARVYANLEWIRLSAARQKVLSAVEFSEECFRKQVEREEFVDMATFTTQQLEGQKRGACEEEERVAREEIGLLMAGVGGLNTQEAIARRNLELVAQTERLVLWEDCRRAQLELREKLGWAMLLDVSTPVKEFVQLPIWVTEEFAAEALDRRKIIFNEDMEYTTIFRKAQDDYLVVLSNAQASLERREAALSQARLDAVVRGIQESMEESRKDEIWMESRSLDNITLDLSSTILTQEATDRAIQEAAEWKDRANIYLEHHLRHTHPGVVQDAVGRTMEHAGPPSGTKAIPALKHMSLTDYQPTNFTGQFADYSKFVHPDKGPDIYQSFTTSHLNIKDIQQQMAMSSDTYQSMASLNPSLLKAFGKEEVAKAVDLDELKARRALQREEQVSYRSLWAMKCQTQNAFDQWGLMQEYMRGRPLIEEQQQEARTQLTLDSIKIRMGLLEQQEKRVRIKIGTHQREARELITYNATKSKNSHTREVNYRIALLMQRFARARLSTEIIVKRRDQHARHLLDLMHSQKELRQAMKDTLQEYLDGAQWLETEQDTRREQMYKRYVLCSWETAAKERAAMVREEMTLRHELLLEEMQGRSEMENEVDSIGLEAEDHYRRLTETRAITDRETRGRVLLQNECFNISEDIMNKEMSSRRKLEEKQDIALGQDLRSKNIKKLLRSEMQIRAKLHVVEEQVWTELILRVRNGIMKQRSTRRERQQLCNNEGKERDMLTTSEASTYARILTWFDPTGTILIQCEEEKCRIQIELSTEAPKWIELLDTFKQMLWQYVDTSTNPHTMKPDPAAPMYDEITGCTEMIENAQQAKRKQGVLAETVRSLEVMSDAAVTIQSKVRQTKAKKSVANKRKEVKQAKLQDVMSHSAMEESIDMASAEQHSAMSNLFNGEMERHLVIDETEEREMMEGLERRQYRTLEEEELAMRMRLKMPELHGEGADAVMVAAVVSPMVNKTAQKTKPQLMMPMMDEVDEKTRIGALCDSLLDTLSQTLNSDREWNKRFAKMHREQSRLPPLSYSQTPRSGTGHATLASLNATYPPTLGMDTIPMNQKSFDSTMGITAEMSTFISPGTSPTVGGDHAKPHQLTPLRKMHVGKGKKTSAVAKSYMGIAAMPMASPVKPFQLQSLDYDPTPAWSH